MQPRSIEILETIKRSTKAFSEYDVLDFAREIVRLSTEERATLFRKARRARKTATTPSDTSQTAVPKLVRGMKADRARDAILAMLEQEHPNTLARLSSAEKKTYTSICRGLERVSGSESVSGLVQQAIAQYSATTSSDWHSKPPD